MKEFISQFTKNSNDILQIVNSHVENLEPIEVINLLEIIANSSSQEFYLWIYLYETSLFINVGCLLVAIHKLGNTSSNIFTPRTKLEDVAPNSEASADFENHISYQFKSNLIRIIANLSFKNKKMQDLVC